MFYFGFLVCFVWNVFWVFCCSWLVLFILINTLCVLNAFYYGWFFVLNFGWVLLVVWGFDWVCLFAWVFCVVCYMGLLFVCLCLIYGYGVDFCFWFDLTWFGCLLYDFTCGLIDWLIVILIVVLTWFCLCDVCCVWFICFELLLMRFNCVFDY